LRSFSIITWFNAGVTYSKNMMTRKSKGNEAKELAEGQQGI
jgi:hypothetical protein